MRLIKTRHCPWDATQWSRSGVCLEPPVCFLSGPDPLRISRALRPRSCTTVKSKDAIILPLECKHLGEAEVKKQNTRVRGPCARSESGSLWWQRPLPPAPAWGAGVCLGEPLVICIPSGGGLGRGVHFSASHCGRGKRGGEGIPRKRRKKRRKSGKIS